MERETRNVEDFSNSILLGTDGSADAALAARAAVDLSNGTGSELHVAHAWQFVMSYVTYPAGGTDLYEVYERRARELLDEQAKKIDALDGTVAGTHVIMNYSPIDGILDLCEELEPGLVVLGSRGLGPVRRIFVGSVSEGVVHHAPCPVLVVRGGQEAWPPRRVVIGDDGSDDAKGAAKLAARIGGLFGAEGLLVRAYPKSLEPVEDWVEPNLRKLYEERPREEEGLEQRAQELEKILGSRLEIRASEGDAAAAILQVAAEGDEENTLLAVGSRGLGVIRRARLGSVSTKVLRAARGPVLVYPHPKR